MEEKTKEKFKKNFTTIETYNYFNSEEHTKEIH